MRYRPPAALQVQGGVLGPALRLPVGNKLNAVHPPNLSSTHLTSPPPGNLTSEVTMFGGLLYNGVWLEEEHGMFFVIPRPLNHLINIQLLLPL